MPVPLITKEPETGATVILMVREPRRVVVMFGYRIKVRDYQNGTLFAKTRQLDLASSKKSGLKFIHSTRRMRITHASG
jgi:hypothetical protein